MMGMATAARARSGGLAADTRRDLRVTRSPFLPATPPSRASLSLEAAAMGRAHLRRQQGRTGAEPALQWCPVREHGGAEDVVRVGAGKMQGKEDLSSPGMPIEDGVVRPPLCVLPVRHDARRTCAPPLHTTPGPPSPLLLPRPQGRAPPLTRAHHTALRPQPANKRTTAQRMVAVTALPLELPATAAAACFFSAALKLRCVMSAGAIASRVCGDGMGDAWRWVSAAASWEGWEGGGLGL